VILCENLTKETDYGWVFFYNSQKFVDTNEPLAELQWRVEFSAVNGNF
jgi:Immunity protein 35